jgi:hypothetical protein
MAAMPPEAQWKYHSSLIGAQINAIVHAAKQEGVSELTLNIPDSLTIKYGPDKVASYVNDAVKASAISEGYDQSQIRIAEGIENEACIYRPGMWLADAFEFLYRRAKR